MNIKTEHLIMLATIGAAAFFMTKKANASTNSKMPTIWAQNPTRAITPQAGAPDNMIMTGLNLINKIWSGGNAPLVRSPGYVPGYFPDTAGEEQARAYYLANQDAFAVNPPTSYATDPQLYASTGGWADSQ